MEKHHKIEAQNQKNYNLNSYNYGYVPMFCIFLKLCQTD